MSKQDKARGRQKDKAREFRAGRRVARLETQQQAQDALNGQLNGDNDAWDAPPERDELQGIEANGYRNNLSLG